MARYDQSMEGDSRAPSDTKKSASAWLKSDYVPRLRGPGPWSSLVGLIGLAGCLLMLFPGPDAVFGICLMTGFGVIAYALRSKLLRQESVLLIIMAGLVIAWAACLNFLLVYDTSLVRVSAVGAACIVVGLARFVAMRHHTLRTIAANSADWTIGDMVAYSEFLLVRRPFSGADQAAKALYQRAAEMVLHKPWHERRDIEVIERFARILSERAPSSADIEFARIWRDHARSLGEYAIGSDEVVAGTSRSYYDSDGWPARVNFNDLSFHRGIPVWRIKVANPDALLDGEAVFRAFLLPEGALLACLVQFESVVDRKVLVHRVFEVTDQAVETYLAGSEHHLRWRIEMYDAKQVGNANVVPAREPDAVREVNLNDSGLMLAFEQVLAHNAALGVHADVGSAYAFLSSTFRDYAASYGIEAAWSTLEAACTRVPD